MRHTDKLAMRRRFAFAVRCMGIGDDCSTLKDKQASVRKVWHKANLAFAFGIPCLVTRHAR